MNIVKFMNGTYGIRKFSIIYLQYIYLDMSSYACFWWTRKSNYFRDCQTTLKQCQERIKNIYDRGVIVK